MCRRLAAVIAGLVIGASLFTTSAFAAPSPTAGTTDIQKATSSSADESAADPSGTPALPSSSAVARASTADIATSITGPDHPVAKGEHFTVTVTFTNLGPADSTPFTGLDFVLTFGTGEEMDTVPGTVPAQCFPLDPGFLNCEVHEVLAPGETASRTIQLMLLSDDSATYSVGAEGDFADRAPGNNTATYILHVAQPASSSASATPTSTAPVSSGPSTTTAVGDASLTTTAAGANDPLANTGAPIGVALVSALLLLALGTGLQLIGRRGTAREH